MKKILVLWASPNTDGLTAACAARALSGARSAAFAEDICLNNLALERCRVCANGWGTCRSDGKYIIEDDFSALYARMAEADALIVITPVYWGDLAEPLKTFLDRLRLCDLNGQKLMAQKRCLLVAAAGGTGNGTLSCLQNMENTLRHLGMVPRDRLPITRFSREYMLPAIEEAAYTLAAEEE